MVFSGIKAQILMDLNYGRGLQYDLREGIPLNESSFYVLEDSWSTKGAQEPAFEVVTVDIAKIKAMLNDSSVVYIGGPLDNQVSCCLKPECAEPDWNPPQSQTWMRPLLSRRLGCP